MQNDLVRGPYFFEGTANKQFLQCFDIQEDIKISCSRSVVPSFFSRFFASLRMTMQKRLRMTEKQHSERLIKGDEKAVNGRRTRMAADQRGTRGQKCHRTIPTDTETFSECLEPNCGISMDMSEASTTSWETPATSLPNTRAYFIPGCGRNS